MFINSHSDVNIVMVVSIVSFYRYNFQKRYGAENANNKFEYSFELVLSIK